MIDVNRTHSPDLCSWVPSANDARTDFPIQNLPYGVFVRRETSDSPRIGVAIGDQVLDLADCEQSGLLDDVGKDTREALRASTLNRLMALGCGHWSKLRHRISALLSKDNGELRDDRKTRERVLVAIEASTMLLPAEIGDYTDFYASIFHATNIGSMFRPDSPLLPNYKYLPVGYHGRASSLVASGAEVCRPRGQISVKDDKPPLFGESAQLDYELEVGCFVGPGNPLGSRVAIDAADSHIFGLCLVNDWSARDIQRWEYQPLGPFLAKSFATSISPWLVTSEALAPFRVPAFARPEGDPSPLPHLFSKADQARGAFAITLEVLLSSEQMRERELEPQLLSRGSFRDMYWTLAQMLAHHTSNGCNLRPGDLLASGTVSGQTKESRGSLLELTWRGTEPLTLPTGETRRFLNDGDEVTLRGFCESDGRRRIGFGECRGIIAPAR